MNVLSPLFQKVVSIGMSVLCSASILTSTGYTKPVVMPAHNIVVSADKLTGDYAYSNPNKETDNDQTTEKNTSVEKREDQGTETETQENEKNEQTTPAETDSQDPETPEENLTVSDDENEDLKVIETFDISATPQDNVTMTLYAAPKKAANAMNEEEKSTVTIDQKELRSQDENGNPEVQVTAVISGSGDMEENVYRYFVSIDKFIDTTMTLLAQAYGIDKNDVSYYLPDDVSDDILEVDAKIEYYTNKESKAGPKGTALPLTDGVRSALDPSQMLDLSPDAIEFRGNVTSVSDSAFLFCNELTEIEIPESVKTIGDNAFGYCKNLTKVTLNEGLEKIETNAFQFCTNLEEIKLPNTIKYIGDYAFFFLKENSRVICPNQEVYNLIDLEYTAIDGITNVLIEGVDNGINYGDVTTNPDDWFNF